MQAVFTYSLVLKKVAGNIAFMLRLKDKGNKDFLVALIKAHLQVWPNTKLIPDFLASISAVDKYE